jgi:hypothetical protein
MRRAIQLACLSLTLAMLAGLAPLSLPPVTAKETESLDKLRERAEAAKGGDRAKLYMRAAERGVEEANHNFDAGSIGQAQGQVKQAVSDADRAAEAARTSGKRLKNTELDLRKLVRRLSDIERTLSVDDRPPVHEGVERLQELDRALLDRMFGRGGK